MAKRTSAQNRAIYLRRQERAKAKGETYSQYRHRQDRERIRRKAVQAFEDLGKDTEWSEAKVDTLKPGEQKSASKGSEKIRELASTIPKDGGTNPFWYRMRDAYLPMAA